MAQHIITKPTGNISR